MTELLVGVGAFMTVEDERLGEAPDLVIRIGFAEQRVPVGNDAVVWRMLSQHPRDLDSLLGLFYRTDQAGARVAVDREEIVAAVGRLRDSALVIGVDLSGERLTDLAVRIAPVPLHRAVTEGVETGAGWPIGTATRTVCSLDDAQHALWSELDDVSSVAHLAIGRALAAGTDPMQPDLARAWEECIALVRSGGAYFDAAVT